MKPDTIMIDDVKYVKADMATEMAPPGDGMEYVIVRTHSAGVFAGYLKYRQGKEVVLIHARRIWYWKGAASLSQLATDGVKYPKECKFPAEVPQVTLTEAIEILLVTAKAKKSIDGVPVWKK